MFVLLASLDNAAITMIPNMVLPITKDLGVSAGAVGGMTAAVILLTAITAVFAGYLGDRGRRKRLLFYGTMVWVIGTGASGGSTSFAELFVAQVVAAVGLGAIASVGFSVIADFVPPHRRGLALSFWGLSQGAGSLLGGLAASQYGAIDWRRPLWSLAAIGAVFAALYLTTTEPPRGASEPELAGHAAEVEERIHAKQIPGLLRRPSNVWLVLKGFSAQLAYGSLIWVPLLYQSKIVELGYSIETSTRVGGLYAAVFQLAAITSIGAGWLGDRRQIHDRSARAKLSAVGVLGAIPFFIAFFFVPLRDLPIVDGATGWDLTGQVMSSFVSNTSVMLAFFLSFFAIVLTSVDAPNAFAMIVDTNLPEHRGTVFGLTSLSDGLGRSLGNGLTGLVGATLILAVQAPTNYAISLALFQLFFIPTGYCYWRLIRTTPVDIEDVKTTLLARVEAVDTD